MNEVGSLTYPRCSGLTTVPGVIEDEMAIKKILRRLDLWDRKTRHPPKANAILTILPHNFFHILKSNFMQTLIISPMRSLREQGAGDFFFLNLKI